MTLSELSNILVKILSASQMPVSSSAEAVVAASVTLP